MPSHTEYVITPQGIMRRTIGESPIHGADAAIARALTAMGVHIPLLDITPQGAHIHAHFSASQHVIATQLGSINLDTYFTMQQEDESDGPPHIVPVFQPLAGATRMRLKWRPRGDMNLWFVTARAPDTHVMTCYIVATHHEAGLWRLPLPNTYEDGRLCMGPAFEDWLRKTVRYEIPLWSDMALHRKAMEAASESTWNADLMGNINLVSTQQIFRFDADGDQVRFEGDWRTVFPSREQHGLQLALLRQLGHDH
ncbi:MAG: hypothetical protein NVV63_12555 [Opitutus sp.]|nr:hypothetical protein [Opitutus sp.]